MGLPDTVIQEDVTMTNKEDSAVNNKDKLEDSEAEAASPIADSVAGEEDPGSALEELVEEQREQDHNRGD